MLDTSNGRHGQPCRPRSVFTRRAVATVAFTAAVLRVSACAPVRYANRTPDGALQPAAIVRIVNETAETYRVSLAYGNFARVLGTVPAFDHVDFILLRNIIVGYEDFELVAVLRSGTGRRNSERFTFSGAASVTWTIDAAQSRAVTLR